MKFKADNKQPAERLSYTISYEDCLTVGDNIQNATASVDQAGLTIDNVGVYDPRVKFWASGGVDGASYKVTVTAYSADGRIFQDEVVIKVKEI